MGWEVMLQHARNSYLLLNIYHQFLESTARDGTASSAEDQTSELQHDKEKKPWRPISEGCIGNTEDLGYVYFEVRPLVERTKHHRWSLFSSRRLAKDVVDVIEQVCQNHKLPVELCVEILECLIRINNGIDISNVRYTPLHPENGAFLQSHLEECWMIMVRCEMLSREVVAGEAARTKEKEGNANITTDSEGCCEECEGCEECEEFDVNGRWLRYFNWEDLIAENLRMFPDAG